MSDRVCEIDNVQIRNKKKANATAFCSRCDAEHQLGGPLSLDLNVDWKCLCGHASLYVGPSKVKPGVDGRHCGVRAQYRGMAQIAIGHDLYQVAFLCACGVEWGERMSYAHAMVAREEQQRGEALEGNQAR